MSKEMSVALSLFSVSSLIAFLLAVYPEQMQENLLIWGALIVALCLSPKKKRLARIKIDVKSKKR